MKCTMCSQPLDTSGFVLSLVSNNTIYTATVHRACLDDKIGAANVRRMSALCTDAGWTQLGLPTLEQYEKRR